MDALRLEAKTGKTTQHPKSTDGGVEQVGVLLPITGAHFPGGQDQIELEDVVPEGTHTEIILTVDIHRGRSGHSGKHGP